MSEIGEPLGAEPSVPEMNPWDGFGPFFLIDVVSAELAVTPVEVRDLVESQALFGLTMDNGDILIPAKQFLVDDEGNIDIPLNLPVVLSRWDKELIDDLTLLSTLVSPQTWLDGQTIFESLRNDQHLDRIVREIDGWMRRSRLGKLGFFTSE